MTSDQRSKLIDNYLQILPKVVYIDDEGQTWNNDFQRQEIAKNIAIQSLEDRIRELELIRGEDVYIYSGGTLEERIQELEDTISEIKHSLIC